MMYRSSEATGTSMLENIGRKSFRRRNLQTVVTASQTATNKRDLVMSTLSSAVGDAKFK